MRDARGRGDDGVHPGCNRTWSAFPPSRRAPCVQDPRPERRWWDGGPGAPSADRSGNDHTRGAHLSRPSRAPRCYPQGSARPSPRSGGGSAGSPAPPAGRARLWSALPVSHQPPPPALFPHRFLAGSPFPRKVKIRLLCHAHCGGLALMMRRMPLHLALDALCDRVPSYQI